MRLLLDTHVLLWWLANDSHLGNAARKAIASPSSSVFVSAVTAWEIAIKRALGKLEAPDDLVAQLRKSRFDHLPISVEHALSAGGLPTHHDDPFDRMLVAQCMAEGLTLVTRDSSLGRYAVATLLA